MTGLVSREWLDASQVTFRCARCDWVWEGRLDEGRDLALEHRRSAHGHVERRLRRLRRSAFNSNHQELESNIRAARLAGAGVWREEEAA